MPYMNCELQLENRRLYGAAALERSRCHSGQALASTVGALARKRELHNGCYRLMGSTIPRCRHESIKSLHCGGAATDSPTISITRWPGAFCSSLPAKAQQMATIIS